jgi:flotillin
MFGLAIVDTLLTYFLKSLVPLAALYYAYQGAIVLFHYW